MSRRMIPTFLCSVAGGMSLVLGMARFEQMSQRFVRLIGLLVLALATAAAAWCVRNPTPTPTPCWTLATVASMSCAATAAAVILLTPWPGARRGPVRGLAVGGGVCGCTAACLLASTFADTPAPTAVMAALNAAGLVLGSFLAGSVTVAWLLGHAYLTATKMTIAPLQRFSRIFSLAVVVRFVYLALCLALLRFVPNPNVGQWSLADLGDSWLILSLRVGVGLFALGAFAYMVRDCVKVRSTQSATGILYFASVFAYVGELCSLHLVSEFGIPL